MLVAAFIHEDLTVGVGAEWRTRPISGSRLLGAKLLGLALALGLVPVLVLLPWWLACGYGGSEIARAVGETWLWQAAVVVLALPLAALTDGYARFLLWTVVAFFSETIFSLVKAADLVGAKPSAELVATRWWVALALAAATSLAVTGHQFGTRRRERSVALLVAGWLATVAVAWVWPWSWVAGEARPTAGAGEAITFTPGQPQLRERPNGKVAVTVPFFVHGLKAGEAIGGEAATVRHTWTWSGGETVELPGTLATTFSLQAARLLGVNPKADEAAGNAALLNVTTEMEPAMAARLRTERPALSGSVRLRRFLVEPKGEEPVRAGQSRSVGAWSQRITQVSREGDEVLVTIYERRPLFFGLKNGIALGAWDMGTLTGSTYWMVDREAKRLVGGRWNDRDRMRVGTVQTTRIALRFPAKELWPATATEAEIVEVLRRMVLAKVDYTDSGEFTAQVESRPLEQAK